MTAPKIGDVMYDDMSWGSADNYAAAKAAGKEAVGIINWISEDGNSAKIVNLKDLKFSSSGNEGNFNPDNPYVGSTSYCQWATDAEWTTDIAGIPNFNSSQLLDEIKIESAVSGLTTENSVGLSGAVDLDSSYSDLYNRTIEEYDKLIVDSSYQGVNLLKNGELKMVFNETRSNSFVIQGADMTSAGLGLDLAKWSALEDITATMNELVKAMNAIRSFQETLGNNYQIIQTRQNFTNALIDALETGADNLTLADMNEESANYLALQTRQQLAINSLSLAAQSAKSILKLF